MIGAPGRVDTVQLTEKTDKGRALARPRKGSFSGTNAEKQADDPLRGLGELGVDHLEQDLGGVAVKLLQGESHKVSPSYSRTSSENFTSNSPS